MNVIYVDTLFLLNAIVDYLLLLAGARIAGEPLCRIRFVLGGMLGGGYAVAIFVLPFLEKLEFKILMFILMILISYGKSKRLLRQACIFLALSSALAGGILAIGLMGGHALTLQGGVLYSMMDLKTVLLSAAVCYGVLSLLFRGYGYHTHTAGELVEITLVCHQKEVTLTCLRDTGNTLKDPITGKEVLIVQAERMAPLFPIELTPTKQDVRQPAAGLARLSQGEMTGRLRLLPYQAVGVSGLLLTLQADLLKIGEVTHKRPLVALSPTAVSDGGGYHGLIGAVTYQ